jgi:hypothetical protein
MNPPYKYRKRDEGMAGDLADVPVTDVARIAATLVKEGKTMQEATKQAYELLEIAFHCRRSLKDNKNHEAGIEDFDQELARFEDLKAMFAAIRDYEYRLGENGERLPVSFDEGLAVLIPHPGVKRHEVTDERMTRFKAFLTDISRAADPSSDEQKRMIEVGERIEQMRRDGIPPDVFERARGDFAYWWKARISEARSVAGKKGAGTKKSTTTK